MSVNYDPFADARDYLTPRWGKIDCAPHKIESQSDGVRYFFKWRSVEIIVELIRNWSNPTQAYLEVSTVGLLGMRKTVLEATRVGEGAEDVSFTLDHAVNLVWRNDSRVRRRQPGDPLLPVGGPP